MRHSLNNRDTHHVRRRLLNTFTKPLTLGLVMLGLFTVLTAKHYRDQELRVKDSLVVKALEPVSHFLHNLKLRARGPQPVSTPIAILAIDEESLEKLGHWPWARSVFAEVIQALTAYQAKNISFDVIFSEEDSKSSLESLQRVRRLAGIDENTYPEINAIIHEEISRGNTDEIYAKSIARNSPKLVMGSYFEDYVSDGIAYRELCLDTLYESSPGFQYWTFQNIPIEAKGYEKVTLPSAWQSVLEDQVFPILQQEEFHTWRTLSPHHEQKFQKTLAHFSTYGLQEEGLVQFLIQYWVDRKDQEFSTLLELALEEEMESPFHQLQSHLAQVFDRSDQVNLKSAFGRRKLNYCLSSFWGAEDPALPAFEDTLDEVHTEHPHLAGLSALEIQEQFKSTMKASPFTRPGRWWTNIMALARGTTYTGFFNTSIDSDGGIRRARLLVQSGAHYIPSIAFLAYLSAHDYSANIIYEEAGSSPVQHIQSLEIFNAAGELVQKVPVDRFGNLIINYAGPDRSFPYLSVAELLSPETQAKITEGVWDPATGSWRLKDRLVDKLEFIKDRHFILGATAVGLYDLRVTPFAENYPGVETHANVLSNLSEQNYLKPHPQEKQYMLAAVAGGGLLLTLLIAQSSALAGLVATLLAVGGVALLDFFLLFKNGYLVSSFLPLITFSGLYFTLTSYKYFTEEKQKKELKGTFQKYVSPAIVTEVLKDPKNLSLGGRKQHMSVFFSDVRGFTTLSEKLDPQELSALLNQYLTPMTEIVFNNKGTLDKYMGDALMAFFGAPISYPDHAIRACRCALEQIAKLNEIQQDFASRGLPSIDIGIGINTGEMSVGNMGSKTVRSYTVMGDAVNLGSRLEGINKEYGTKILISEYTQEALGGNFWTREIDRVRVKGKVKPVRIFELLSEEEPPASTLQLLDAFQMGYALYMKKRFSEARQSFAQALQLAPDDSASQLFLKRCEDFIASPPPEDWDGVYVMNTK